MRRYFIAKCTFHSLTDILHLATLYAYLPAIRKNKSLLILGLKMMQNYIQIYVNKENVNISILYYK